MSVSGACRDDVHDRDDAPGIFFTGSADTSSPPVATSRRRPHGGGRRRQMVTYQGAGHVPWGQKNDILAKTTDWFYRHLDLANAAQ